MNRHFKKILIGLPILLFIILNTYLFLLNESLFASEKPYEVSKIEKRDLREAIHATAVIVPKDTQEIYYEPHRGTIDEVLVEEGEEITAGSEILSYQSTDIENQITALENEIDELETEQEYYEDQEDLLGDQIREEESKDEDEQNDSTVFLLEQQQSDAEYQANRIDSTISSKESEITQLKSQLDEKVVTSNIAGTVEEVSMNTASGQKPIVVIASENDVVARAYLGEDDVFLLKEGDEVDVTIAKGEKRKGIIAEIGKPDQEKEELRFPVDIELNTESETQIPIGSTVKMTANPVAVEKAVAVKPESILHDDGNDYVLVVKNDYIDKRKVSFGFENKSYKEVTKGLKAKEVIVKKPNVLLVEDMEIEIKNMKKEKKAKNDSEENPSDKQDGELPEGEENNTIDEEPDSVDLDDSSEDEGTE